MKRFKRIYIEITNVCNMNCKFCPKDTRNKQSMAIKQIDEVLKKVKDYTDYIYLHVKGEPLMHEKIGEVLDLAKKYGLNVIITTNGTLLKQKIELLKDNQALRQINISVHSFEQNGVQNPMYIKDIIEAADEIAGSGNIYISYRLWNLDTIQNVDKNKEALEEIGRAYGINDIIKKLAGTSYIKLDENKFINLDTTFKWPSLEEEEISSEGCCLGLIEQIAILVDGTVVPCCLDSEGVINLGNIFIEDIQSILDREETKSIIEGFKKNKLTCELCRKCEFRINKRR